MPDIGEPTGFKSYRILLEDFTSGTPGGSTEFVELTDVPSSYSASGLFLVRVNAAMDGLEFVDPSSIGGGSGHTIQEEGSSLTQRTKLNFIGSGVTAEDNAGADATDITITVPSIAGLLDETAHDLLDHTGLTGVGSGDMVLASIQTVTGEKVFDKTKLSIKGSSTGKNIIDNANASATDYTQTLPAKSGTFAMTNDIANSRVESYSETATAAGTTTLTVSSNYM
jgi:hypothetical protein